MHTFVTDSCIPSVLLSLPNYFKTSASFAYSLSSVAHMELPTLTSRLL